MYLLNLFYSLNQSYIIADTAINQAVTKAVMENKGIKFVSASSSLNKERTNVLINVEIKLEKNNNKIKITIEKIEKIISEQIKLLIGKNPQNIEIVVGLYG